MHEYINTRYLFTQCTNILISDSTCTGHWGIRNTKERYLENRTRWLRNQPTNSIDHSPFSEANSSSASQEIPRILLSSKVHCLIHNSQLLFPIPDHINPAHTLSSYFLNIHVLSHHLSLGLTSGLLPSGLHNKALTVSPLPFTRVKCYSHLRNATSF